MSRRRRHAKVEMGESISFEDVLTVMTVLLLLRLIFMVPLVNLDKAKTIAAHGDAYWFKQAEWVLRHPADSSLAKPYRNAFSLEGKSLLLTNLKGEFKNPPLSENAVYLEASSADSTLTVLQHDLANGKFISMTVQGHGHSQSFRRGNLIWSQEEAEWFPASDSVDYGSREDSKNMEKGFRAWTKAHRGY